MLQLSELTVFAVLRPMKKGLVHDSRHVCFHIIMMQIRHMISEGANKLLSTNFALLLIMSDSFFIAKFFVLV